MTYIGEGKFHRLAQILAPTSTSAFSTSPRKWKSSVCPAAATQAAVGRPMIPGPMKPTFMLRSPVPKAVKRADQFPGRSRLVEYIVQDEQVIRSGLFDQYRCILDMLQPEIRNIMFVGRLDQQSDANLPEYPCRESQVADRQVVEHLHDLAPLQPCGDCPDRKRIGKQELGAFEPISRHGVEPVEEIMFSIEYREIGPEFRHCRA